MDIFQKKKILFFCFSFGFGEKSHTRALSHLFRALSRRNRKEGLTVFGPPLLRAIAYTVYDSDKVPYTD